MTSPPSVSFNEIEKFFFHKYNTMMRNQWGKSVMDLLGEKWEFMFS